MLHVDKNEQPRVQIVKEFQGIVLAGHGNRLSPLTESASLPKALLPVANKPMIWYQLQWLEKAGVQDIIVVCHKDAAPRMNHYLSKVYEESTENGQIRLQVVDADYGTAEVLQSIRHMIERDFIVLSCDTILDVSPRIALDTFRVLHPTACVLFHKLGVDEKGNPMGEPETLEFVGIEDRKSQLVYKIARADCDDSLLLDRSLTRKFSAISIHATLRDSHAYIFRKWVLQLLDISERKVQSIATDLLPFLLKLQYKKSLVQKYNLQHLIDQQVDCFHEAKLLSSTGFGVYTDEMVSVSAIVIRDQFVTRADTLSAYLDVNLQKLVEPTLPKSDSSSSIASLTKSSASSNVTGSTPSMTGGAAIANSESMGALYENSASGKGDQSPDGPRKKKGVDRLSKVGDYTRIGDTGVSLKKSIVGSHCFIGNGAKITNCVIMDHVVIEPNVKLERCIIGNSAKVGANSVLKECAVAVGFQVPTGVKTKQERFSNSTYDMSFSI